MVESELRKEKLVVNGEPITDGHLNEKKPVAIKS